MLKNRTKNSHTDPYHPSDLFNLNGEGITWEEVQQSEQDKKQHVLVKVLACLLIIAADIVFYLQAETITYALGIFGLPLILFVGSILGVLSLWVFAYLYVSTIVWYRKFLMDDDTPTDSSKDDVLNYVRDNSLILKEYRTKTRLSSYEERLRGEHSDLAYAIFEKEFKEIESGYPDPIGKLSSHVIAQKPIYLPVDLNFGKIILYVIHPEDFPYKTTLKSRKFGENSTKFATSAKTLDLKSIKNININEYFEALPDLFAKEKMRDALTAYIYAEHQYYEVEKTARRVLPEWTDDDSVLLEDYSALRRWYANYIATCKSRIIELIEDYARELEFKNAQKRNRSEAISRALTV